MNKQSEVFRIVLICNNVTRELATLTLLKNELESRLGAQVRIIGSIAEIQRIYYSLYKFQPHLIFLSQLQEKCCRDFAEYAKKSGAMVFVMPEEITPAKIVESLILRPDRPYDHLVDGVFLPGQVMMNFFGKTNIKKQKIKITGSPKVDVEKQSRPLTRNKFCRKFGINGKKKNIFVFTSFPHTGIDYFKKDECFEGNIKLIANIQRAIRDTQKSYLENLPKICKLLPEFNIILKPHPLEDLSHYKKVKAPNLHIISNISMLDCLGSIDVAIHWNSTVSTSCWLHSIPTLQYSPLKKHDWLLSGFTPGNPLISDIRQLVQQVRDYATRRPLPKKYIEFQKKYLYQNFYIIDGKSCERISKHVGNMISKTDFKLEYKRQFSGIWYLISIMEKIIGVYGSRRIMSLISSYNWQYAKDNYLP